MGNSIALFKQYIPLIDEVYKTTSLTADLDGNNDLVRQGANANELIIPKIDMDGLGDYSRSGGYPAGDVTLTNETVACNFDRGRKFAVDAMDDQETAGLAFGKLAGEFERTKVVPELDAFRFAKYAENAGETAQMAASDAEELLEEIAAADAYMGQKDVPVEGRYLYINYKLKPMLDTITKLRPKDEVLGAFEKVTYVPPTRFYTAIDQYDGTTAGQTAGGYVKRVAQYAKTTDVALDPTKTYYTKSGDVYTPVAEPDVSDIATYYEQTVAPGAEIAYMIIHRDAPIQFTKHLVPKVIDPETNQTSDGWIFAYRNVSIADVYENKTDGIVVVTIPNT